MDIRTLDTVIFPPSLEVHEAIPQKDLNAEQQQACEDTG